MGRGETSARIVDSASTVIDQGGVLAASLEQVRRGAGVSTGSIYHHFPAGLAQVTDAVYLEVLRRYHDAALAVWVRSGSDRGRVRDMVVHLLVWIETNPLDARRMFQLEDLRRQRPALGEADERSAFTEAISAWLTAATGPMSDPHLVFALWSGPAKEYARTWLRDLSLSTPSAVTDALADAAWAAVQPHLRATGALRS